MRLAAAVLGSALLVAAGAQAAGGPAAVSTAYNKQLKTAILVNAKGFTLYMWTSDTATQSVCVNDPTYHCSKHWIPLRTTGDPVAKGAAKTALLGTLTRDDGTTQVTYKGHPLYTWTGIAPDPGDKKPGQINGQCYLSLWYVLTPAGKMITKGC